MVSLSPVRKYKNVLVFTSGLSIEIIRNIVAFIDSYKEEIKDEAELQGFLSEWNKLLKTFDTVPDKKKKKAKRAIDKKKHEIETNFSDSGSRLDAMFAELMIISRDANTLLYRELEDILQFERLLDSLMLSAEIKLQTDTRLWRIADQMAGALDHFWMAAKAQARGWTKLAEMMELKNTQGEKRRMKMEAIEIRGVTEGLAKLKEKLVQLINAGASHKAIHEQLHKIIEAYETEYHDLHKIMHRTKVLIHRTERLIHRCEHYANQYGGEGEKKAMEKLDNTVHSRLDDLLKQTRRQMLEFKQKEKILEKDVADQRTTLGNIG